MNDRGRSVDEILAEVRRMRAEQSAPMPKPETPLPPPEPPAKAPSVQQPPEDEDGDVKVYVPHRRQRESAARQRPVVSTGRPEWEEVLRGRPAREEPEPQQEEEAPRQPVHTRQERPAAGSPSRFVRRQEPVRSEPLPRPEREHPAVAAREMPPVRTEPPARAVDEQTTPPPEQPSFRGFKEMVEADAAAEAAEREKPRGLKVAIRRRSRAEHPTAPAHPAAPAAPEPSTPADTAWPAAGAESLDPFAPDETPGPVASPVQIPEDAPVSPLASPAFVLQMERVAPTARPAVDARSLIEQDKGESVYTGVTTPAGEEKIPPEPKAAGRSAADPEAFEYRRGDDRKRIRRALDTRGRLLGARLICCLLAALASALLALGGKVSLPLVSGWAADPALYARLQLLMLGVASLAAYDVVGGGIARLLTLRADATTPIALATAVTVLHNTLLAVHPTHLLQSNVELYTPVVAFGLVAALFGRRAQHRRMVRNFETICETRSPHIGQLVTDETLAEAMRRPGRDHPTLCQGVPVDFYEDFFAQSTRRDPSDYIARVFSYVLLVFSVGIAGWVTWMRGGDAVALLSVLSALLCISAPFTYPLCVHLPLLRAARKLHAEGAMLSDSEAVQHFSAVDCIVATEQDLMPEGSVLLHGIKTFDNHPIDEAIIAAVSLVRPIHGCLSEVFMKVIENREDLLFPVEGTQYLDGKGVFGWRGNCQILFGSREMMIQYGIPVPSRDYEQKYDRDGRSLLYLAVGGALHAMFIISYNPDGEVGDMIFRLARNGVMTCVATIDPNLNEERLGEIFDVDPRFMKVIDAGSQAILGEAARTGERTGGILYGGDFLGFASAVLAAIRLKNPITLGILLQIVGMLLGFGVVVFFAASGNVGLITALILLCYQLFWTLMGVFWPNIRSL